MSFVLIIVNPIPAGVLENQDMLGGGQFDPPSTSHVLCPNMTNDTSLESSCALLLELQICKNWIFYRKIQFYSKNVCKKEFVQNMKNYSFLKSPWPCHLKYAIFCCKTCAILSLCQRLSKNKYLVCYRKKQSFRQCAWGLRQLVLKPGFRPKRRALGI